LTPVLPWPREREDLVARLHLNAVLPALEDLARLDPVTQKLIRGWDFALRMQAPGGNAATIVSQAGAIRVYPNGGPAPGLKLQFFSSAQVNRTFLKQKAMPPLPIAGFWRLGKVKTFTALTERLDEALQPKPEALRDPAFETLHLTLLFRVLIGSIPIVGNGDGPSRHGLGHTPAGIAEIRAPALGVSGWVSWDGAQVASGMGASVTPPDVIITFINRETAAAALLGRLDPNAAVALGNVEVRGLVPLADGLSLVMDRAEFYLKPA
jgi:hypothetical protein